MEKRKYKVLVLGGTGMLGHAVVTRLREVYNPDVIAYTTKALFPPYADHPKAPICGLIVGSIYSTFPTQIEEAEYVINCIGMIKPRCNSLRSFAEAAYVNGSFPCMLADYCTHAGTKLIHITTDCIYNGLRTVGKYTEEDSPDVSDVYGLSKATGDLCKSQALVLRTSIIGTEPNNQTSLVEWVRKQNGQRIKGYTNHFWNGITTTEFANICIQIIEDGIWRQGLYHVPSPNMVSKWELVTAIAAHLNVRVYVDPIQVDQAIDRTLGTIYHGFYDKLHIHPLMEQISSMPDFNQMNNWGPE